LKTDFSFKILEPFIARRPEIEWGHHIFETPRDLWWVQGIEPPSLGSAGEKLWIDKNKAVQWQ